MWKAFGLGYLEAQFPDTAEDLRLAAFASLDAGLWAAIDNADNGLGGRQAADEPLVTLQDLVASWNPGWDAAPAFDEAFSRALPWMRAILERYCRRALSQQTAEMPTVIERHTTGKLGSMLFLDRYLPLGESVRTTRGIEFAVYPNHRDHTWVARAWIPRTLTGTCRNSDLVFLHPGGFLGVFHTQESAVRACRQSMATGRA